MADEYGKIWRYPVERQHVVNNPVIFNKDIDLQRRMFWEAAQSTGILVEFYNCVYDDSDFNNDPNNLWEDKIILPIIFDDHPKVKVIKELGWFTEDDERPMLAYLPIYKDWTTKELLHLREQSLMRVFYYGNDMPAEFRVTDKKMDSLYGVYWVCKLAPERINEFYFVQEGGRHFLKLKTRDDEASGGTGEFTSDMTYDHSSYVANIAREHSFDNYFDAIMNDDSENTVDFYIREENEEDLIGKNLDKNKEYSLDDFTGTIEDKEETSEDEMEGI